MTVVAVAPMLTLLPAGRCGRMSERSCEKDLRGCSLVLTRKQDLSSPGKLHNGYWTCQNTSVWALEAKHEGHKTAYSEHY